MSNQVWSSYFGDLRLMTNVWYFHTLIWPGGIKKNISYCHLLGKDANRVFPGVTYFLLFNIDSYWENRTQKVLFKCVRLIHRKHQSKHWTTFFFQVVLTLKINWRKCVCVCNPDTAQGRGSALCKQTSGNPEARVSQVIKLLFWPDLNPFSWPREVQTTV